MPTYRNDSTSKSFRLYNISGERQTILPTESIKTYEQDIPSDLTLTSDAPIGVSCGKDVSVGLRYDLTSGQAVTFTKTFEKRSTLKEIKVTANVDIDETLNIHSDSILGAAYDTLKKSYSFAGTSHDYYWAPDSEAVYQKGEGLVLELTNNNNTGIVNMSIDYTWEE
jgi:hypothetical protein